MGLLKSSKIWAIPPSSWHPSRSYRRRSQKSRNPQEEITNQKHPPSMQPIVFGAGDRDRTGTGLVDPRDFKSLASAYSATPARGGF